MPDTMIDPKILLKDEIANLPIYKVGAKYEALAKVEANLNAEPLRLGSNENPYGPNPRVIEAIQNTLKDIHRYPDNTCAELATKVGTLRGVDPGRIMFDSGSESVLATLINFCMRRGDKIVSLSPTFPLINILSQAIGAEFIAITHEDRKSVV